MLGPGAGLESGRERFTLELGRERFTFGAAPNRAPLAAALVFWVTRAAVIFLALAACGKSTLTSSTDLPAATLTPSGTLALYPHTYGAVLPWHVETAEASWAHVAPCVGVSIDAVRAFPVYLTAGPIACPGLPGTWAGCTLPERIEIIGVSHDFDPRDPDANPASRDAIARLFRHELIHLGLHVRDGDLDLEHRGGAWRCEG